MGCLKPSKHKEAETTERAKRLESHTNKPKEEETPASGNKSESGESGDNKVEISSTKAICSSSTVDSFDSKAEFSSVKAECSSSIDGSFRMSELHLKRDKRNHFWKLAPQSGGRPEVWQVLRVVAEAELGMVVQILAANNIQLAKEDLTKFRDCDGREYELPRYVLRAYHNTDEW